MEWGQYYRKIKAAGGKRNVEPPTIEAMDECILNCIYDLSGERNASGDIPFSKVLYWGSVYDIPKHTILFYWDTIKVSEGKIKEWQLKRSV